MKEVIIIGAGGHARVIADIIKKTGDIVFGFLDDADDVSKTSMVLGKVSDCVHYSDKWFVIGIGDNNIRKEIAERFPDLNYYTAIHPNAVISDNVKIGEGCCVMANAVINDSALVSKHCIINTHATIEHDVILDDYVHVSPGAVLCGTVNIGKCTHVGAGAIVKNNISITGGCVIGVGAAVVKDIKNVGVYVGVPARMKNRD